MQTVDWKKEGDTLLKLFQGKHFQPVREDKTCQL